MKYRKHFAAVAILMPFVAGLTYLLLNAIYTLPIEASAEAVAIADMFQAHFIVISVLFALVVTFMLFSVVVFRRRPGDEEDGDHFHGNTVLEIAWTIIPLAVVLFFAYWGTLLLGDITEPEPDEMVVRAFGQQWSWFFEYPELDDLRTEDLVLPVGRQVRLEMTALDVLHSFWVPEFRVKQDLVPGQVHQLRITPITPGEYKVRCAEVCGTQHAYMLANVTVMGEEEFEAWAQESAFDVTALAPAERGEVWAGQFGCLSCHAADDTVIVGPGWGGLYGSERPLESGAVVTADEEYLRNSILDPHEQLVEGFPPVMPANYEQQFAEVEANYDGQVDIVEDLIAYIRSLSDEETE